MSFTKFLRILLSAVLLFSFCFAGYNEISRYRPLEDDEKDFVDPNYISIEEYMKKYNVTSFISSGFRPTTLILHACVVSIRTRQPTAYFGDNHFCTGVIISARVVLTAAHCVVDGQSIVTRPKRLRVFAGSPYRLKKEPTTLEFRVVSVHPHGKFKRSVGHDLALLILLDAIPKTHSNIKIMSLAHIEPEVGTQCYTMGWGQLFWDGPYADHITYGNLSIIPHERCAKIYGAAYHENTHCVANPTNPYVDTCRGDSGAPLICNNSVAGIVLLTHDCSKGQPTMFTDTTKYVDWILNINRGEQCKIIKMHLFLLYFLSSMLK